MSKAFTRELDDEPELLRVKPSAVALPFGVKNYITPTGYQNLQTKLHELEKQPASPSIRQRIFEMRDRLQLAVVVEPPPAPYQQVLFGATVTVRSQTNDLSTYRIVGVDETDLERDYISWRSPLAKALLKAHLGDRIRFQAPTGAEELEITGINYES